MLKKKILGIAVFILTAIGFTYGVFDSTGYYYVGNAGQNVINGSYTYNIDNKANFNTELGNDSTKSFYWNVTNAYGQGSLIYNIGRYNGKLYFLTSLDGTTQVQGFIQNICIKPITSRGNESLHEDCTYSDNIDILNSINTINGYAFEIIGSRNPSYSHGTPMQFCFSDGNNDYCLKCGFMNNECASGITGTLNISNTNFNSIKDINWGNSPINGGGNNGTGGEIINANTGAYCPKIRIQIDMYGNKYNKLGTGICYSYAQNASGQQLEQKSIFQEFPTYQELIQGYNIIVQNCHGNYTYEQCQTALTTLGSKKSQILYQIINNELELDKTYQYCHLQLDYTQEEKRTYNICQLRNEGTYYATGLNEETNSNPNPLEALINIQIKASEQENGATPGNGTIFDEILPDGIISFKDVALNINFWKDFLGIYSKITGIFISREYKEGILPVGITSLILLILLFKIRKR